LTEAKARVGRARKTRADLERQLKACKREIANARERLIEATKQQTATSEMLRIISDSPLQSVLDVVAERAAHLCDSNNAEIYRLENNLLRLVASYGELPVHIQAREGFPVNRDRVMGRAICDRRSVHVHDLAAEDSEYPSGSSDAKRQGHRTTLGTPLLRERTPIGVILFRRWEVRPFSDNQIALLESFADQAAIAIENVRLFEAEKQRTLALAQANRDLAEREAKIRRLVDSNIIGIMIGDARGHIIEANEAFLDLLGYAREDLVSDRIRWTKLTPAEWAAADQDAIAQLSATGICKPYEKEYFRTDGSRVPVLVGGASFEGKRDEGVVFVIDMTERKRAEQALRESEAKFRDYAETASDWFWEICPDYKFTLLTENAFGARAADRIGTACWDHALDLETEPEKWRLVRATLDSRKPFRDLVYRGLSGNGSPMYVKASGKPVFDANGEFRGYRGTGSDVTALMRAQEQQTAISEVLRAIANSPHDLQPIFDAILDSATRLCRADSGALRLSEEGGLRLVAVRGDPFLVNQVWSSIPVLAEKGSLPDRLAASRLPTHIPDFTAVEGDHRDDFLITVVNAGIRTGLFVPLLKDDEIVGLISLARKQVQPFTDNQISLFRDFAAQATIALESTRLERQYREAQMALAHANRVATMGQLTASITHEVNQPITAAVTYALAARRFLSADPPNCREVDAALSLIVKEGHRAREVVERVRALIKKVPARKDAVAIDDAILEVVALTRTEAANNSVSVRTQFAGGVPHVQGDRVQLQQVTLNLIVNAIQAMSGIGKGARELQISIDAVPSEGGVRVGVRDTGPGLSPESLSRLFEPFYTTKPEGMGMGLCICRSIIEAHGGRLWAIPCEPQGALFQFTIPATRADGS
jgi:PAS domain S-box-containing protein